MDTILCLIYTQIHLPLFKDRFSKKKKKVFEGISWIAYCKHYRDN